jgi:hypothetical protein
MEALAQSMTQAMQGLTQAVTQLVAANQAANQPVVNPNPNPQFLLSPLKRNIRRWHPMPPRIPRIYTRVQLKLSVERTISLMWSQATLSQRLGTVFS